MWKKPKTRKHKCPFLKSYTKCTNKQHSLEIKGIGCPHCPYNDCFKCPYYTHSLTFIEMDCEPIKDDEEALYALRVI